MSPQDQVRQRQPGTNNYINSGKDVQSISPTVIIPLLTDVEDTAQGPQTFRVRTLLDSGSGTNWIVRNILPHVKYTVKGSELMEVYTFHGAVRKKYPLVEVYYRDLNNTQQALMCYVHDTYIRHVQLNMTNYICSEYKNCTPFSVPTLFADPGEDKVCHKDESLGVAMVLCSASINQIRTPHEIVNVKELNLLLEPTIFGVAISGEIPDHLRETAQQVSVGCTVPHIIKHKDPRFFPLEKEASLTDDISFIWTQESLGIKPVEENVDHTKAWELFLESITRNQETGQYTVRLPYNEKKHLIADNITGAAARTYRQQELMFQNKEYGKALVGAKEQLVTNDNIELVNTNEPAGEVVYYMPFRAIIKPDSDTTKCRLVMDASSKPSSSHVSLNQALYQGPNLIVELAMLLLRFMLGTYATIADIEKAFLRILIAPCDRDALRFFWFVDPWDRNSKLVTYRFKAVMFGSAASPFQLAAVLTVLIRNECTDRQVQTALLNRIYVDDVTFSHMLQDRMVHFFNVATQTLRKGTFNLRQWASNSPQLMDRARVMDVAKESKNVKVLGMLWNIDTDTLGFNNDFSWNNIFTKRAALRFCNQIFDPLGLLSPIIIRLRLFIQGLWKLSLPWDKSFELISDLKQKWIHLVSQAHIASKRQTKRAAVWTDKTEIHIFSDASKDAYGAVAYTRTPPCKEHPNGNIHLICSKSKVTPIEGKTTIPRLELAGLVVAAHQVPYLTKAWNLPDNFRFHIWCDAKVVLEWLQKRNISDTYVNNRVKQARQLCKNHWESIKIHYVPTDQNPADIITRQQKAEEFVLNNKWWKGPEWLLEKDKWPQTEETYCLYPDGKPIFTNVIATRFTSRSMLTYFDKGDFFSNIRVTAYCLRAFLTPNYGRISKTPEQKFIKEVVSVKEMNHAKVLAIKIMQKELFAKELAILRGGKEVLGTYKRLKLHLDPQGIIRCRHRLTNLPGNETFPILVHGDHPFARGYIRSTHVHTNCASRQYTLHIVRKEIEGPCLTTAIKKIVWDCDHCRILRARPYSYPMQPPLPKERLIAERPFAVCGVDYSGPHHVKQGRGTRKVWISLFTCMVSRAIHLEIVPDLTSQAFLQVLRTMSWKKAPPKVLLSDNATCFVGADNTLQELSKENETITGLTAQGMEWHFTPARAPWFGAVYERLIGVLKKELIKLVGHSALTYHELAITLAQIEGVINNRPLVQVGEAEVITPMNILTGRNNNQDDMLAVLDCKEILLSAEKVKDNLPRLYQDTERRLAKFWQVFQQQYLEKIKFSEDTSQKKGGGLTPKVGDLVIIHSHDPRLKWRKALVLENVVSKDGIIRVCRLRTSTGEITRALKHIYPLEINVEKFIDKINEKNHQQNDFEGFDDLPSEREAKALKLRDLVNRLNIQSTN